MRTQIITAVAASLIAGSVTAAPKDDDKPRETGIGLGSGAAIGAIAGGPVGFFVGAMLGAWAGDKHFQQRKAKQEYKAMYEQADELAGSLEHLLADSETEIDQLKFVMRDRETSYRDALQQALNVEVYFHTGQSALDVAVADRIQHLGKIMQQFDDITVVLEGHADPRGDEIYNEQLSAERAAAVRETLIAAGVKPEQITTRAAGESQSAASDGDLDAMALERRVDLRIVHPLSRENRVAQQ